MLNAAPHRAVQARRDSVRLELFANVLGLLDEILDFD